MTKYHVQSALAARYFTLSTTQPQCSSRCTGPASVCFCFGSGTLFSFLFFEKLLISPQSCRKTCQLSFRTFIITWDFQGLKFSLLVLVSWLGAPIADAFKRKVPGIFLVTLGINRLGPIPFLVYLGSLILLHTSILYVKSFCKNFRHDKALQLSSDERVGPFLMKAPSCF